MQLSGPEIKKQSRQSLWQKITHQKPNISIRPFDPDCLGSNSYDLHLDKTLRVYKSTLPHGMKPAIEYKDDYVFSMRDAFESDEDFDLFKSNPWEFDSRNPLFMINPFDKEKETIDIEIPKNGLILLPAIGYLGSTVEYTETFRLFPYIDGKSSIGRNFILTHHTAGRGDDGFCGTWTLEINTKYPTLVKPNMRIGQIYYDRFCGKRKPYGVKSKAHYNNQIGAVGATAIQIDSSLQRD